MSAFLGLSFVGWHVWNCQSNWTFRLLLMEKCCVVERMHGQFILFHLRFYILIIFIHVQSYHVGTVWKQEYEPSSYN